MARHVWLLCILTGSYMQFSIKSYNFALPEDLMQPAVSLASDASDYVNKINLTDAMYVFIRGVGGGNLDYGYMDKFNILNEIRSRRNEK